MNNCLNKLITVTQVSSGLIINVQNQTISEPKHFEGNKGVSVFCGRKRKAVSSCDGGIVANSSNIQTEAEEFNKHQWVEEEMGKLWKIAGAKNP